MLWKREKVKEHQNGRTKCEMVLKEVREEYVGVIVQDNEQPESHKLDVWFDI